MCNTKHQQQQTTAFKCRSTRPKCRVKQRPFTAARNANVTVTTAVVNVTANYQTCHRRGQQSTPITPMGQYNRQQWGHQQRVTDHQCQQYRHQQSTHTVTGHQIPTTTINNRHHVTVTTTTITTTTITE